MSNPARRFHLCLIAPEGNVSVACLAELMETLAFGMQMLGHETSAGFNEISPDATNIVLGAHLLPLGFDGLPPNTIIYNSEQLFASCPALEGGLAQLVARHETWDYSPRNIASWRALGCGHVKLLPTGYAPQLTRIAAAPRQDIDVLFYGAVNERRRKVLESLSARGLRLEVAGGVYGAQRDALIARAKVVLNLHYYPSHIFETARVSYLLANRKAVVAEVNPDTDIDVRYAAAVEGRPYSELVDACLHLLRDPELRRRREDEGFRIMKDMPAQDFLAPLLAEPGAPDSRNQPDSILGSLATPVEQGSLCLVTFAAAATPPETPDSQDRLARLLAAGLPAVRRVLCIGADADLAAAYQARHPGCECLYRPDAAAALDLAPGSFGLVLLSELAADDKGEAALSMVRTLLAPAGVLWLALDNACQEEDLFDLMAGDQRPGARPGHFPETLTKRLLDAEWLPSLRRDTTNSTQGAALAAALAPVARSARMSQARVHYLLQRKLLLLECHPLPTPSAPVCPHKRPHISVVFAVNDHRQLRKNALISPGLLELDAPLCIVEHAASAAEALAAAKKRLEPGWILFCHQDVYFPRGLSRWLLPALLDIPEGRQAEAVLGFIGLARHADGMLGPAGMVVDRGVALTGPPSDNALSLDELAILVHTGCLYQLDPALGWHLWATDLCLQARRTAMALAPRAIQAPVFHNTYSDWTLPPAFHASVKQLFHKYPQLDRVASLCGEFTRPQVEPSQSHQHADEATDAGNKFHRPAPPSAAPAPIGGR